MSVVQRSHGNRNKKIVKISKSISNYVTSIFVLICYRKSVEMVSFFSEKIPSNGFNQDRREKLKIRTDT